MEMANTKKNLYLNSGKIAVNEIPKEIIMTNKNQSLKINSTLNLASKNKSKTAKIKAKIIWERNILYSPFVSGAGLSKPKGKVFPS